MFWNDLRDFSWFLYICLRALHLGPGDWDHGGPGLGPRDHYAELVLSCSKEVAGHCISEGYHAGQHNISRPEGFVHLHPVLLNSADVLLTDLSSKGFTQDNILDALDVDFCESWIDREDLDRDNISGGWDDGLLATAFDLDGDGGGGGVGQLQRSKHTGVDVSVLRVGSCSTNMFVVALAEANSRHNQLGTFHCDGVDYGRERGLGGGGGGGAIDPDPLEVFGDVDSEDEDAEGLDDAPLERVGVEAGQGLLGALVDSGHLYR